MNAYHFYGNRILPCQNLCNGTPQATGKLVLDVIARINRELGTTVLVITHNAAIAGMADRVIRLSDGRIASIEVPIIVKNSTFIAV